MASYSIQVDHPFDKNFVTKLLEKIIPEVMLKGSDLWILVFTTDLIGRKFWQESLSCRVSIQFETYGWKPGQPHLYDDIFL